MRGYVEILRPVGILYWGMSTTPTRPATDSPLAFAPAAPAAARAALPP